MNIQDLIEDLIVELSYQSLTGIPDLKDKESIRFIYEYFSERGLSEVGQELINNLLFEEDNEKKFRNPRLNQQVQYKDDEGNDKEGLIGNLLRLQKDQPGREAAERALSGLSDEERQALNKELGGEGGGGQQPDQQSGGEDQSQPETGKSLNPKTKSGQAFTKQLSPTDPEYTGPKKKTKTKASAEKKEKLKEKFSKKSEVADGLIQDSGRELPNGTKVRDIIDEDGNVVEVNTTEGRKKAATVIRKKLASLEDKIIEAIENFGEGVIEVKKWLGEVGEMSALAQILEEDVEAYLLTDSERKNDIVFIKKNGDESTLDTGYLSVKTTLQGEQVNKLGANCKADLEKLAEGAKPDYETSVNGKSFNLKPTNVLGSVIDIKSAFFAKFSLRDGVEKIGKDNLTKVNEETHKNVNPDDIIEIDGIKYFKGQSTYLKNIPVTEEDINDFFDNEVEKYLTNLSKPEKGKPNQVTDPNDLEQTKEYLREMFLSDFNRKKEKGESYTLYNMHDTMYYVIGNVTSDSEMPVEATTDTMAIEFGGKNINPNVSVIKKEDSNKDIQEQLDKNKTIIDERERLINLATGCLNIRSRTRAIGNPRRMDGIDNISPLAKKPTEKRTPISEHVKS